MGQAARKPKPERGTPERKASRAAGLFERYPAHAVEEAARRERWLRDWRRRCHEQSAADAAQDTVREAKRVEGAEFPISERSLRLWQSAYTRLREGRTLGLEGLIDKRACPEQWRRGEESPAARDPAAIEWFYSLYRTENKLGARLCHDATVKQARKQGWAWPGSYAATTRWLREHDNRPLTYCTRHGWKLFTKKYLRHVEQDYSQCEVGELWTADHHRLDWWATDSLGRQFRPWLTAIQDCRSRCIVGWHVGKAPHQDAIVAAMRMAFRDWAIPEKLRIDNGKDFTSQLITGVTKEQRRKLRKELGPNWRRCITPNVATDVDRQWLGICGELGIELIYAQPYSPWSKSTLERFFGTLEGQHGKTQVTYCGNSALNKPECLDDIRRGYTGEQRRYLQKRHGKDWKRAVVLRYVYQADIPTLDQVRTGIEGWLTEYHWREHRGLNGAKPLEVWRTAKSLRRAEADELLCLMNCRGIYRVSANGVTLKVGAGPVSYGAASMALKSWIGRDVAIFLDPARIDRVWATSPGPERRAPIGWLTANTRISPTATVDDVRQAIADVQRDNKAMRQAQRSSARRTRTMAQRINAHAAETQAELRKTGTDDKDFQPAVRPVRTGFEGVSRPAQGPLERAKIEEPVGDLSDFLPDEPEEELDDPPFDDDQAWLDEEPAPPPDRRFFDWLHADRARIDREAAEAFELQEKLRRNSLELLLPDNEKSRQERERFARHGHTSSNDGEQP